MCISALKCSPLKSREEIQHIYVNEQSNCHICSPQTTDLDTVFNYNINWSFVTTNYSDNITFSYFTSKSQLWVAGKSINGEEAKVDWKKRI